MKNIAVIILGLFMVANVTIASEDGSIEKRPFLVVYDYGMGGVWLLIDARSVEEIESKYPKLKAYEDKPDWMSNSEKSETIQDIENIKYHWDIDENPTGWLADL